MSAFVQMTEEEVRAALRSASEALAVASVAHQLMKGSPSVTPRESPVVVAGVKTCIIEAAPDCSAMPVSRRKLAIRAGYSYTSYFRRAVDELVIAGLLEEDDAKRVRRRAR